MTIMPDDGWVVMAYLSSGRPWVDRLFSDKDVAEHHATSMNREFHPQRADMYKVITVKEYRRALSAFEAANELRWL